MILYHGSNEVVDMPSIIKTKYTKDFGWGFYTTGIREQAEKWAHRRAVRAGTPTVSCYLYEPLVGLSIKEFTDTSDEWLDFVVSCRNGELHSFDIVSGPMADDTIWDYLRDFLNGSISREAFHELVKFRHPTHQMSFHTMSALASLKFLDAEELT